MPVVLEPPEAPPLEPLEEDASSLWELLYESLGFHVEDDASGDLQRFCEALCAPGQSAYDLVRERDDQQGWAILLDPDECPADFLSYLAQWVGVKVEPLMGEEQLREEIKAPTGWRRGELPSIELVTQRGLTGSKWVRIKTRTPSVGHTYIRTLLSETPDPARKETELRAEAPAWEQLDYNAIEGVSWADVEAGWETFDELAEAFTDFDAVEHMLPDELPE